MGRLRLEAVRWHGRGPVDLALEPGSAAALSGPSGSGKTLLLRAVADLDPHEGEVWLDGTRARDLPAPEWRRQVALLPAESRWWRPRVGDHLGRVEPGWLERLGFGPDVLGWDVERLSTGERQRLALLRLLANRPEALLLDEPTANLDATSEARVETLLADYRAAAGAAVLWVTHDPAQGERVATRRLRLDGGKLVEEERAACR